MDEKRKGGRPKGDDPRVAVTVRLKRSVVAAYQAKGDDWRAAMEAALAEGVRPKLVTVKPAAKPRAIAAAPGPPKPAFKSRLKGEWKAP